MEVVRAGAHGYVLKTIDVSLLIRSIRAVSNGQTFIDPAFNQRALNGAKDGPS